MSEISELNTQTIYYLKSIERQLRQIAEEVEPQPTLASEVLWDNLNWLGAHIQYLEKEAKS